MWWSRLFLIAIFLAGFYSCNPRSYKSKETKEKALSTIFPFSDTEKVEILSYPNRFRWDTILVNGKMRFNERVVSEKKLNIKNLEKIKDRKFLNEAQKTLLFKILSKQDYAEDTEALACYSPRHLVLFYNNKGEIISYIEMFLTCSVWDSSEKKWQMGHAPSSQSAAVWRLFKKAGITYFGEDEY